MPRRRRLRCVSYQPPFKYYGPPNSGDIREIVITLEEFESIRLADYLNMSQVDCAQKMKVSQPTFHRILSLARHKIADALINGKRIIFESGSAKIRSNDLVEYVCPNCNYNWKFPSSQGKPKLCPNCSTPL